MILTVPETISETMKYYPVGSEWVALPELNQCGQLESFNVISEHHKGMSEFRGGEESLLTPSLGVDGTQVEISPLDWTRLEDWIPRFLLRAPGYILEGTVFCPSGFRGFVYLLKVTNTGEHPRSFHLGWRGSWENTVFTAFSTRKSLGNNVGWYNRWTRTLTLSAVSRGCLGRAVRALADCQWRCRNSKLKQRRLCSQANAAPLHKTAGLSPRKAVPFTWPQTGG